MRVSGYGSIGLLAVCLAGCETAWGQAPRISPGGIVNAASLRRGGSPNSAKRSSETEVLALGSIVSIFGEHLAAETAAARATPLPRELAGTRVLFDGIEAPLFFVSPRQINLQVPKAIVPDREDRSWHEVDVEVRTAQGSSGPDVVDVGRDVSAPGVFTLDASGCGEGVVLNIDDIPAWALSLHSKENSLSPGGHFLVFGTGIGEIVAGCDSLDGYPSTINESLFGSYCLPRSSHPQRGAALGPHEGAARTYPRVSYAGRAPGYVGVDQWNVQVPEDAPEGCSIPFRISTGGGLSQTIPLHIRQGGGRCEEKQAVDRLGEFIWERRTVSKWTGTEESFELRGRLEQGIEGATIDFLEGGVRYHGDTARRCPPFARVPLDGGVVTAILPDGTRSAAPSLADAADPWFHIPFEVDRFRSGEAQTTNSGGPNVGPFQTSVQLQDPIMIENQFPPGTRIFEEISRVIRWTGGTDDQVVWVVFDGSVIGPISAAAGEMEFLLPRFGLPRTVALEIIQEPSTPPHWDFVEDSLNLGGRVSWRYVNRFESIDFTPNYDSAWGSIPFR